MDPFVSCPYNAAHRVPKLRIQSHLVKCQANHPELTPCPYNATHRLKKSEIKAHLLSCPSRNEIYPEDIPPKAIVNIKTTKFINQSDYLPETDPDYESWD